MNMKRTKSMYLRQVTVMLGLIILCMVLLGAGFFSLSYRHQLEEIQTTLDRNAGFISSYANAAITKGDSLSGEDFINYIYSAVRLTDTTVLVCNTKGQIPVSYTHLDVYKRQDHHRPPAPLRPGYPGKRTENLHTITTSPSKKEPSHRLAGLLLGFFLTAAGDRQMCIRDSPH